MSFYLYKNKCHYMMLDIIETTTSYNTMFTFFYHCSFLCVGPQTQNQLNANDVDILGKNSQEPLSNPLETYHQILHQHDDTCGDSIK